MHRVNSKGEFNVPKGKYANPAILDEKNLDACNKILKHFAVSISHKSFTDISPKKNHLVYADPPYDEAFNNFSAGGFELHDQKDLRDAALSWHKAGTSVMISNSDTQNIRRLYSKPPWNITEISAPRFLNSNPKGRGAVVELVIRNYK